MNQTKLEIIGPYTPDHPGPFCTRDLRPARVVCTDMKGEKNIVAIITTKDTEIAITFRPDGLYWTHDESNLDLMNAREVPVAREFWLSEYRDGVVVMNRSKDHAEYASRTVLGVIRTIHVREVLPGEGE